MTAYYEETQFRSDARNYVWDVDTLAWVPWDGATSTGGGTGGTVDQGTAGASPWLVTGPLTDTQLRATAVPVSLATLPLATNAATGTKQDTGNTSLASIDGKITAVNTGAVVVSSSALPSGAATDSTVGTRLSESDFDTKAGSLTEAAPATDTASSGLNGRLQRIAQRLTSLITALGSPFQAGGSIGNTTFASTQSGTWTVQPGNTANTTAWKVDGSAVTQPVSGTFWQTTQPVSGTFWQTTQPVSGPLTDTQLRAVAVPVSGTFWQSTQPVSAATLPLPTNAATESGNLATIAAKDFATQTTLALIKAKTDNLDAASSTLATASAQTTGNTALGSIKTNTDPLVAAAAGGYVRQDSTGTIAKESGGNLATIATNTTSIATAALQTTGNASLATIAAAVPTAAALDGVTVTYTTDSLQRRIAELDFLQNYATAVNALINAESETSQRMGFELR